MFNKSLHFLPDGFGRQDYIVATFFIEEKPDTDIIKFSEVLAVDMSTGTWTAVKGETEEMRQKYAAKVVSMHEVPNYEFELPDNLEYRRYVVSIAVPFVNIGPQIPMLLTTIIGNVSVMGKIKLLDIDKTNPQRASFIFKDSQQRKEIAEEYIFNNGQIEPKAFTSAIKELKQLLYSNIN